MNPALWVALAAPFIGAAAALGVKSPGGARGVGIAACTIQAASAGWLAFNGGAEIDLPWIEALGARIHLVGDGPALTMTAVGGVIGASALLQDDETPGSYVASLLFAIGAATGVFLAADLLLFVLCFEAMLLPMTVLLAGWGKGPDAAAVARRTFVWTQAGGIATLGAALVLYAWNMRHGGVATFDLAALGASSVPGSLATVLFIALCAGFAVKLPVVPLHGWQADAYATAPSGAAMVFGGLLGKTGAWGLWKVALVVLPGAAAKAAPYLVALGLLSVIYGGLLAVSTQHLRRRLAFLSLSHLGLLPIGIAAHADEGVLALMVAHGLSTAGMLGVVSAVERRGGERIDTIQGLWARAPYLSGAALLFSMASLGLPGLGNFVGEFLILGVTFRQWPIVAVVGQAAVLLATLASLGVWQGVFTGMSNGDNKDEDLSAGEALAFGVLAVGLVVVGLFPASMLDLVAKAAAAVGENG